MTGLLSSGQIAAMTNIINKQANAELIALRRPGGIDRSGDPTGLQDEWTGAAPALLDREEREILAAGDTPLAGVAHVDTLTILDGVAPIIDDIGHDWDGWTVVINDLRFTPSVERAFSVTGMDRDAYRLLDSMTLTLGV
jgi:hypothetical protein